MFPSTRKCKGCGEHKSLTTEYWHRAASEKSGFVYACKLCANNRTRKWYKKNGTTVNYKTKVREAWFQKHYGLSLEECTKKLADQNNRCAICQVKLLESGYGTHLDHCHKTGKLRMFLCSNCNRGLGHFMDSTKNLKAAITYLEAHTDSVVSEGGC